MESNSCLICGKNPIGDIEYCPSCVLEMKATQKQIYQEKRARKVKAGTPKYCGKKGWKGWGRCSAPVKVYRVNLATPLLRRV